MTLLIAGLAIFFATHLAAAGPARAALTARLGERGRKLFVAVPSLIGLVLVGMGHEYGASAAQLYQPPLWGQAVALHAMPFAFIIVALAYVPGRLRRPLRHPMLLGVLIWAGLHLLANGELVSVLLFGSFALYAPAAIAVAERRGYAAPPAGSMVWDAIGALVAIALYYGVFRLHGWLFGPNLAL